MQLCPQVCGDSHAPQVGFVPDLGGCLFEVASGGGLGLMPSMPLFGQLVRELCHCRTGSAELLRRSGLSGLRGLAAKLLVRTVPCVARASARRCSIARFSASTVMSLEFTARCC